MKSKYLFMYLFLFLPLSMAWGQNDTLKLEDIVLEKEVRSKVIIYHLDTNKTKNLPDFTKKNILHGKYKSLFGLTKDDSFVEGHRRGNYFYKGVFVEDLSGGVTLKNGTVKKVFIPLRDLSEADIDTCVSITMDEALGKALTVVPSCIYPSKSYERMNHYFDKNTRQVVFDTIWSEITIDTTTKFYKGKLFFTQDQNNKQLQLAYRFTIPTAGLSRVILEYQLVYIDPKTGELIKKFQSFNR